MDRLKFTIPSDAPKQDAEILAEALRRPTSAWPIPGKWRIGWKARRVILLLDVPLTKKTVRIRTGLFRWREEVIDASQVEFAGEQVRERWPASIPFVPSEYEVAAT